MSLECRWTNCEHCEEIAALRQAAIDAAIELDWTKNEPPAKPEDRQKAQRIVDRVFAACEALDGATFTSAVPA